MTATLLRFPDAVRETPRMAKKMLWFKFYPGDWRGDQALRGVSLAARGLWIDMLTVMHESVPRGSLLIGGRPASVATIARLCGAAVEEVTPLVEELEAAGVFSRKKNGTIYSRRMELDEARRLRAVSNGKKGGNPTLKSSQIVNDDDDVPENRGRIEEESSKIEYKISDCKDTEISGGVKGTLKPKRLETREDKKERTPIPPQNSDRDGEAVQACVKAWNALAGECDLSKVQHVTGARRAKLIARLKDVGGLPGWFATCDKVRNSAFLRGKSSTWCVTFDWLLSPTNLAKVLEGNYDDRKPGHASGKQSVTDAIAVERRRILDSARDLEGQGDANRDVSPDPDGDPFGSD